MVVLPGWCFELGFMPSNHFSGSDKSRPEMGIKGIMNRARGMQIVENGFHVRMVFLLLGLLLSIVNLPIASGGPSPAPVGDPKEPAIAPPPLPPTASQDPPPSPPSEGPSLPPPGGLSSPPSGGPSLPPPVVVIPFPPRFGPPPPAPTPIAPPVESPPPPPPSSTIVKTGDTWNESEKAGVVIASIAALLQVAVVAFLLIKRHQMLTTVEYDDIDDLEYDTPRASNFRDIESA